MLEFVLLHKFVSQLVFEVGWHMCQTGFNTKTTVTHSLKINSEQNINDSWWVINKFPGKNDTNILINVLFLYTVVKKSIYWMNKYNNNPFDHY